MSIFGTIMAKVFGASHPAASDAAPAAPASGAAAVPTAGSSVAPASSSSAPVDVAAILDGMEDKSGQDLDWRKSIVDLMKLLGLDSSLTARKTLAGELHYTGDTDDSATMNIWLHKEVMQKFTENGGKVPSDLH